MDASPNAPRIEDGALRYATTHPTNSLRLCLIPCSPASFSKAGCGKKADWDVN